MYSPLSAKYCKNMLKFVGSPIIRIKPTKDGSYCFTEKIVYLEAISPREIRISWDSGDLSFNLTSQYLDENWVPLQEVLATPYLEYEKFEGKYVIRIPSSKDKSYSFQDDKIKLIKATKTHLFLKTYHPYDGIEELTIIFHEKPYFHQWVLNSKLN